MHSQLLSSLPGRKSQQQNICISSHPSMYALTLCEPQFQRKPAYTGGTDLFALRISVHPDRERMAKKQGQKTDGEGAGRAGSYSIFKGLL